MVWKMDINEMLTKRITKITNSLLPPDFEGDVRSLRLMQSSISEVINHLGQLSATEQGLSKVITTADKLRTADNQVVYILKEPEAKDGKGEAVGILKVGRKHLFLFDENKVVREVEPLCLLDFFVLQDRQRRGYGKTLFDHMLQDTQTPLHALAIDGPSEKLDQFLRRHYGVTRLLRQSNNFAVTPQFFATVPAITKSGGNTPSSSAAHVGRYSAAKPHSSIGRVIHGDGEGEGRQSAPAPVEGGPVPAPAPPASPQPAPVPSPAPAASASAPAPAPAPAAAAAAAPAAETGEAQRGARPSSLPVSAAAPAPDGEPAENSASAGAASAGAASAGAPSNSEGQLTDKGFFDVKFYHQKLW